MSTKVKMADLLGIGHQTKRLFFYIDTDMKHCPTKYDTSGLNIRRH